ncbi:GntR family transcriptional regulator [Lawsonibacter sp. LCP25S3_G6]|uniref:GntR family transcriptional regulator n=1 Tax=unclassified Lawsonibacter TaxID=2617946 RepID=UPI003F982510
MKLECMDERRDGERGREYAYRVLRHNIVTMCLPPDTVLNESELIECLEMSRTPIREALILLKDEGLVDIMPQRGSKVSRISLSSVREGYFMRLVLENVIVQELAGKLSADCISLLKENLANQEEVLNKCAGSISPEFFFLDDAMHMFLYKFSGRERIGDCVHKMCAHFDRVRYLDSAVSRPDQNLILEEHKKLYYYLSLGIPADVDISVFCQRHLGRWLECAQAIISAYPDYFTD